MPNVNGVIDPIVSATISGVNLTISATSVDSSGTIATAMVSGGVNGVSYNLNCQITTAGGLIANSQDVLNCVADSR